MLMDNVIKRIQLQHPEQIVLLNDENAVLIKAFHDVCDKFVRIVQIVEHCNRSYYFRLRTAELPGERIVVEEIVDYFRSANLSLGHEISCRLKSNCRNFICSVRSQKCSVIRAYVDDNVSGREFDYFFGLASYVGKRFAHRLVYSRLVPILHVHQFGWRCVSQLQKSASSVPRIAQEQVERYFLA